MSDRVAVMNAGILEQIDAPTVIYGRPSSRFVADFIGESNLFEGVVDGQDGDNYVIKSECGIITGKGKGFTCAEIVYVSVRPENTKSSLTPVKGFSIQGTVKDNIFIGTLIKTIVVLPDSNEIRITVLSGQEPPKPGTVLHIYWNIDDAVIMHTSSQKIYSLIENIDLSRIPEES
jgi:spermidine/putrescine transport system ATP-binding protein